jgi:glucose/mannose-6-phosphate isomerase
MSSQAADGLATMLSFVESLPDQLTESLLLPGLDSMGNGGFKPHRVILCGMGGSAIGGDLVQGLLSHQPVSLDVWRNYGLPHWAAPGDLVIAASYSGNTEECLSAVAEARNRGVSILAITSGGQLADLVLPGESLIQMPPGLPPRAALGYSFGALLGVLARLQMVENLERDLQEATALMKEGHHWGDPTAQMLAAELKGRIPVLYVADPMVEGVAVRWKGQLNENAKVPAQIACFPELDHNDIVGWGLAKPWPDRFVLIILKSGLENRRLRRRVAITRDLLQDEFASVHELTCIGESPLARILSLVHYGDYVSCHLAGLREIDPMPVQRIDQLKSGLSEPDTP